MKNIILFLTFGLSVLVAGVNAQSIRVQPTIYTVTNPHPLTGKWFDGELVYEVNSSGYLKVASYGKPYDALKLPERNPGTQSFAFQLKKDTKYRVISLIAPGQLQLTAWKSEADYKFGKMPMYTRTLNRQ